MRISKVTKNSYVNGPGRRNVLHVQGCTIGCPGCFNSHTWSAEKGTVTPWHKVYEDLVSGDPDGITISGGEPTEQWSPIMTILERVRLCHPDMSVIMFTGITYEDLKKKPFWDADGSRFFDLIVAGPYRRDLACNEPLWGSTNQELVFITNRISKESLDDIPDVEVHIDGDTATIAGFPTRGVSLGLMRALKE